MPPYCNQCWTLWNKNSRTKYLEEELTPPVGYAGKAVRDFKGERVHVLQIGLGTFGTFLKPDISWILTLLEAPIADGFPPREEELLSIRKGAPFIVFVSNIFFASFTALRVHLNSAYAATCNQRTKLIIGEDPWSEKALMLHRMQELHVRLARARAAERPEEVL